jgi:hypothetical protein
MMRVLAAAGANPTTPTRFGVTPLMAAACLDYYEGETADPSRVSRNPNGWRQ